MQERECDFCKKQYRHGGNCAGKYSLVPCLYERDPRGMWKETEIIIVADFRGLQGVKIKIGFGYWTEENGIICSDKGEENT